MKGFKQVVGVRIYYIFVENKTALMYYGDPNEDIFFRDVYLVYHYRNDVQVEYRNYTPKELEIAINTGKLKWWDNDEQYIPYIKQEIDTSIIDLPDTNIVVNTIKPINKTKEAVKQLNLFDE